MSELYHKPISELSTHTLGVILVLDVQVKKTGLPMCLISVSNSFLAIFKAQLMTIYFIL